MRDYILECPGVMSSYTCLTAFKHTTSGLLAREARELSLRNTKNPISIHVAWLAILGDALGQNHPRGVGDRRSELLAIRHKMQ